VRPLSLSVALLYAMFAAAAAALNLGTQWAVVRVWPWGLRSLAALAAGTAAGLLLKYVLDKRWIFGFRPPSRSADVKRFLLYTCTGIATTALFWGVELLAIAAVGAPWARYAGGAAGLGAGYAAKYALDRWLVFSGRLEKADGAGDRHPAVARSARGDAVDHQPRPGAQRHSADGNAGD
jgi:putative flippase GtrA